MTASRLIPPPLIELQRRCNLASTDHWHHFSSHRQRVTELALQAGGETLAVLGAGNCNDLDLEALAQRFREIHLIDLDRDALERVRARSPASIARRLVLHAPIDLSGCLDKLAWFRRFPPNAQEVAALPSAAVECVRSSLPLCFDTVISSCVLSQILHGAAVALEPRHTQLPALSCALVLAHARSLALLVAPGGSGVLVTDMASFENQSWTENELDAASLASELERTHRAASGTGLAFLARVFENDSVISPLLGGPPRHVKPWIWRFSDQLCYLVHAFGFRVRKT